MNATRSRRSGAPAIKPFWLRLNRFFLFPLQGTPLLYALGLSAASLSYLLLFFLPPALAIVLVEIGILLAASRYAFKVIAFASQGMLRTSDYPLSYEAEWTSLPWKLFRILLIQGVFVGVLDKVSPALGWIGNALVALTLPATVVVLVQSCSFFQALNPLGQLRAMRAIGKPYLLLCLFLFLLDSGISLVQMTILPRLGPTLTLPIANLVGIYFSWVMASLLGYVMYQYHEALGIDPVRHPAEDKPEASLSPEKIQQNQLDTEVAQMIGEGDLRAALATAYESQRVSPDNLQAQRRYHRVLLLSDRPDDLRHHTERFIALLLRTDQPSEALKTYQACKQKLPDFSLLEAKDTLSLARQAWRNQDAQWVLKLLSGFDKRHRGDPLIAHAYELIAQALVKGMGRPDLAEPVLKLLEQRFPGTPQTSEVQWMLRKDATTVATSTRPA